MQYLVYEASCGGVDSVAFVTDDSGGVGEVVLFGGAVGRAELGLVLLFTVGGGALRSLRGGSYPTKRALGGL